VTADRNDNDRRRIEDLLRRSSLGSSPVEALCARTPKASASAILLKAAMNVPDPATPRGARGPARLWRALRAVPYPRRRLLLATGWTAFLALFLVLPRLDALGERLRLAFVDLVPAAAALACAVMCFHATRRRLPDLPDREARHLDHAWRLLGLAGLAWGLGELAWTWYELTGRLVPVPSLADAGFVAAVPLMTAALLAFPAAAPRRMAGRLRVLLDGVIIAMSLFGVTWLVSIDVLVANDDVPWLWERAVAAFYPLGDVVNLAIAVAALAHTRKRALASFGLITAGIACIGVSDLCFLYLTQRGDYASGDAVDLGWSAGFFLIGFAALHRNTVPERPRGAAPVSPVRLVLPHAAMGALVGAVALTLVAGGSVDRALLAGTMLVVLLSVGRHVAFLLETTSTSRRLVSHTDELEREAGAMLLDADEALTLLEELGAPPGASAATAERALDTLALRSMLLEQRARELTWDARRLAQQPPERSG
jgi:hypothetical protein